MRKVLFLLLIAIIIISCSSSNEPEQRKPKTSIEISKTRPNDLMPLDVGNWWEYKDQFNTITNIKVVENLGLVKWVEDVFSGGSIYFPDYKHTIDENRYYSTCKLECKTKKEYDNNTYTDYIYVSINTYTNNDVLLGRSSYVKDCVDMQVVIGGDKIYDIENNYLKYKKDEVVNTYLGQKECRNYSAEYFPTYYLLLGFGIVSEHSLGEIIDYEIK